ncbi:MAG: uracil-DNA glycosylase [Gemmatimonadota bacterium]|nr:uracil-DNA glycosylase [Gemmatimonadota bacterium]
MGERTVDVNVETKETLAAVRTFIQAQAEFGLSEFRLARTDAAARLTDFHGSIRDCRMCGLCESRRAVVFGSGNPEADLMFVGEAPGAEEDRTGMPFVGPAGELLTRMIEAIGFQRDEVYIANVIKCRPPGNRDPKPEEVSTCKPFLERQIEYIQPVAICALGLFAARTLLETDEPMSSLRGRLFSYRGIHLIPTYHPAALLRNRQWKRPAWEDLQHLRRVYDNAAG